MITIVKSGDFGLCAPCGFGHDTTGEHYNNSENNR